MENRESRDVDALNIFKTTREFRTENVSKVFINFFLSATIDLERFSIEIENFHVSDHFFCFESFKNT